MNHAPTVVVFDAQGWSCPFKREMMLRLTYLIEWREEVQMWADQLLSTEVLGEVSPN